MTESDVKLILPEVESFEPADYVRDKLIPLTGHLHRLCNEFFNPGCTAEEGSVDMMPTEPHKYFEPLDKRVTEKPKSCIFKAEPGIPLYKGEKRLKILLSAIVYVQPAGTACFRLVRSCDGMFVEESLMQTTNTEPVLLNRYLSFGNQEGRISPFEYEYRLEAKYLGTKCYPICRRFSLVVTYV